LNQGPAACVRGSEGATQPIHYDWQSASQNPSLVFQRNTSKNHCYFSTRSMYQENSHLPSFRPTRYRRIYPSSLTLLKEADSNPNPGPSTEMRHFSNSFPQHPDPIFLFHSPQNPHPQSTVHPPFPRVGRPEHHPSAQ